MINDTISDLLTRIRNGQAVRKKIIPCPYTNLNKAILQILKDEGYIHNFKISYNTNCILVKLKYLYDIPVINDLQKISKNSKRVYVDIKNLPILNNGLGIYILSTSKGIISNKKALEYNIGGELLCKIF